jgi:hypothetical protein
MISGNTAVLLGHHALGAVPRLTNMVVVGVIACSWFIHRFFVASS